MNNKQLQLALEIATLAHKNVERRNGDPYIFHVLRVANNTKYITTKLQKTVALLHDVIEDTPFDADFLREKGISQEVLNVLALLTHNREDSYDEYINKVCTNLDQGTLPVITERDRERFIVYENARIKIMATLASDYPEVFKLFMNR